MVVSGFRRCNEEPLVMSRQKSLNAHRTARNSEHLPSGFFPTRNFRLSSKCCDFDVFFSSSSEYARVRSNHSRSGEVNSRTSKFDEVFGSRHPQSPKCQWLCLMHNIWSRRWIAMVHRGTILIALRRTVVLWIATEFRGCEILQEGNFLIEPIFFG